MWHVAQPLLEMALDHTDGEHSIEEIRASLEDGHRALWIVFNGDPIAAITTRIDQYKSGMKIAVIDFAGGEDFQLWSSFTDYIEPYYRSLGCKFLEIAGRPGWQRLHASKGFKPKYTVLRKHL